MPVIRDAARPRDKAHRMAVAPAETLAATRTITTAEIDRYQAFAFDPGGAGRDVNLPPEARSKGAFIYIANTADAAEILTIKEDGGTTICTPTQAETAVLWCDGTTWFGHVGANS